MQTVIVARNNFEPETWTRHDVEDVLEFCQQEFPVWPKTARIYHRYVSQVTDVTPTDEASIERLRQLEGVLYIVDYPAGIELIIIAVVAVAAVAAAVFLLAPQPPALAGRANEVSSPNNSLSERLNSQRIGGRIGDIYGRVRSTPDLLTVPYKVFLADSTEVELSYMCIGRGHYDIELVRDGDTLISEIEGSTVEVYKPFTSPNNAVTPQLRIGDEITDALVAVEQVSAVNGQTMIPPGGDGYTFATTGTTQARARANWTNRSIEYQAGGAVIDFTNYWNADDILTIDSFNLGGGNDLDGTYEVSSVTATEVILVAPELVNGDWNAVDALVGDVTPVNAFTMSRANETIGPFTIDMPDLTQVYCNFVALGGLYTDDGTTQTQKTVTITVTLTPVDANGNPRGPDETFDAVIVGSSTKKDQIGYTLKCNPTFTGRCKVSAYRVTQGHKQQFPAFTGNIVEEVKWRECYGVAEVTQAEFGNVTTVYSRTYGTTGALAVKERKLNMYVTRKLPTAYFGIEGANDKYTKILLHFDGDDGDKTVKDNSPSRHKWTFHNGSVLSSAAFKFNDASLFCTTTPDDGITAPDHDDFTLNNHDFTIEGWFKFITFGSQRVFAGQLDVAGGPNINSAWYLERTSGNIIRAIVIKGTSETVVTGTTVFSTDVGFIHIAFVRRGNILNLFINGVKEGGDVAFTGQVNNSAAKFGIGRAGDFFGSAMQGYIDEFRLSVGIARYTANFTPPTQHYGISFGKLAATRSARDAILSLAFDENIGNRQQSEVDSFQIRDVVNEIETYFGTAEAVRFDHTFDINNLSFEETIASVADTIFCTAYRRGSQMKLAFEKATEDSTLLFNHRNKIPRSEVRSISFGNQNNHDGVWFSYTNDVDGTQSTLYIPSDQSSINPKKVDSIGVTSELQAYFKAWRLWNKIRYQNMAIQFEATQEADIAVLQDRVLVADNTRDDTQDGEIIDQTGLEIELSVDVDLAGDSWTIYIQHYDGSVQSLGATAGSASNKVVLASAPALPLALEDENYARPTFVLVRDASADPYTKILLHFEGQDGSTAITDSNTGSVARTWTPIGTAQLDSSTKKFGSTSALVNAGGDGWSTPDHADFALGSSDFCIDAWFNCTAPLGFARAISGQGDDAFTSASSYIIRRQTNGVMCLYVGNSGAPIFDGTTIFSDTINTGWHHIAVTRSAGTFRMFIDGKLEAIATSAFVIPDSSLAHYVGRRSPGSDGWIGWIDEFRFSVGTPRWTKDFTPPRRPYGQVQNLACMVTEKSPKSNFTVDMIVSNYDPRYYEHDQDHILEII